MRDQSNYPPHLLTSSYKCPSLGTEAENLNCQSIKACQAGKHSSIIITLSAGVERLNRTGACGLPLTMPSVSQAQDRRDCSWGGAPRWQRRHSGLLAGLLSRILSPGALPPAGVKCQITHAVTI